MKKLIYCQLVKCNTLMVPANMSGTDSFGLTPVLDTAVCQCITQFLRRSQFSLPASTHESIPIVLTERICEKIMQMTTTPGATTLIECTDFPYGHIGCAREYEHEMFDNLQRIMRQYRHNGNMMELFEFVMNLLRPMMFDTIMEKLKCEDPSSTDGIMNCVKFGEMLLPESERLSDLHILRHMCADLVKHTMLDYVSCYFQAINDREPFFVGIPVHQTEDEIEGLMNSSFSSYEQAVGKRFFFNMPSTIHPDIRVHIVQGVMTRVDVCRCAAIAAYTPAVHITPLCDMVDPEPVSPHVKRVFVFNRQVILDFVFKADEAKMEAFIASLNNPHKATTDAIIFTNVCTVYFPKGACETDVGTEQFRIKWKRMMASLHDTINNHGAVPLEKRTDRTALLSTRIVWL